jgi:hypothetical protein
MSAEVLAFPRSDARTDSREVLLPILSELHALITIDPILGASPARILFVLDPQARQRVAASVAAADAAARAAGAYALVTYDFPFALQQFAWAASHIPPERAKTIISRSAALQQDSFSRAAASLGVHAWSVPCFDAGALKAAFFPNTQETVTHLFHLSLD